VADSILELAVLVLVFLLILLSTNLDWAAVWYSN
jgi:hypothetical protein